MKKVLSIVLAALLVLSLAGCSVNADQPQKTASDVTQTSADTDTAGQQNKSGTDDTKSLVVYFSRAGEQYGVGVIEKGNTAIVAEMVAEETGADSFEIVPKEDNYPTTYDALTDYAKEEQNSHARPKIASEVENFDSYDTVYLGYPIWWGDLPMIVYTFLESYDFSGKTIVPFCTHAGSGNAGTQSKIQLAVPNADVKEVLAVAGTDTQNKPDSVRSEVTAWLSDIG